MAWMRGKVLHGGSLLKDGVVELDALPSCAFPGRDQIEVPQRTGVGWYVYLCELCQHGCGYVKYAEGAYGCKPFVEYEGQVALRCDGDKPGPVDGGVGTKPGAIHQRDHFVGRAVGEGLQQLIGWIERTCRDGRARQINGPLKPLLAPRRQRGTGQRVPAEAYLIDVLIGGWPAEEITCLPAHEALAGEGCGGRRRLPACRDQRLDRPAPIRDGHQHLRHPNRAQRLRIIDRERQGCLAKQQRRLTNGVEHLQHITGRLERTLIGIPDPSIDALDPWEPRMLGGAALELRSNEREQMKLPRLQPIELRCRQPGAQRLGRRLIGVQHGLEQRVG